MAIANRGHIFPGGHTIGFFGVRSCSCGGPGQDNYIRTGGGDLLVADFFAGRKDHGSPSDFHELSDPWRRTDAWIRPGLAIDSRAKPLLLGTLCDRLEPILHRANDPL